MIDYYAILGLPHTATFEEIEAAYKYEAAKCHPDIDTSTEAKQKLALLDNARALLSNTENRHEYDQLLKKINPPQQETSGAMSVGKILLGSLVVILTLFRVAKLFKASNSYDRHSNYYENPIPDINTLPTRNRSLTELYLFDVDSFARKIKVKPNKKSPLKNIKYPIIIYEKINNKLEFNTPVSDFLKESVVAPIYRDSIKTIIVFERPSEVVVSEPTGDENNIKISFIDARTSTLIKDTSIVATNGSDTYIRWHILHSF
jgi:curved DNA-binding protein CbpA